MISADGLEFHACKTPVVSGVFRAARVPRLSFAPDAGHPFSETATDSALGFSAPLVVLEASLRSRLTPSKKPYPSLRQLRATAENCSRCHLTVMRDPMVIGRCTRMQAPEREVSSNVAGT